MRTLKKAAGAALIYAGFLGGSLAACAAEGLTSGKLFTAIVGCGIALLGGVAMRGGAAVTCDFLLRTRERRGCPSGKGCTRKRTSGKVKIRRFAEESTGEKGGWYDD